MTADTLLQFSTTHSWRLSTNWLCYTLNIFSQKGVILLCLHSCRRLPTCWKLVYISRRQQGAAWRGSYDHDEQLYWISGNWLCINCLRTTSRSSSAQPLPLASCPTITCVLGSTHTWTKILTSLTSPTSRYWERFVSPAEDSFHFAKDTYLQRCHLAQCRSW